ncbi:hypothetical protein [Oceanobacillus oncorhynchi]|uniref:hypothetical protein n=1 Tax=Oceanobacillus oncorhynchi TaxID=545501 RepID=UPI0034D6E66F
MKKVLFILLFVLFLGGCGEREVSESFDQDVEQVLPIIEKVHDEQREYSENESDLLDSFYNKYRKGQYYLEEENDYYEMNDIEKAIFNKVNIMYMYADAHEDDEDAAVLASEVEPTESIYDETAEELEELMKVKKVEDLPEEYKDKYPTYEITNSVYPAQFESDAKEVLDLYEPIINGTQDSVNDKEWYPLVDFLDQYQEDESYNTEYEQDGKHYLVDGMMKDVIETFNDIKTGVDEGHIPAYTIDDFNSIKEDLELFGTEQ